MKSLEQWKKARAMLRAGCPIKDIATETGIGKTQLYREAKRLNPISQRDLAQLRARKKAENPRKWDRIAASERGRVALAEVEALQTLNSIEEEKSSWSPEEVKVHDQIVLERLTQAFAGSAIRNQRQADHEVLDRGEAGEYVCINDLKKHAELTKTNRHTVLGPPVPSRCEDPQQKPSPVLIPKSMLEN